MRTFTYRDDRSDKFWNIELHGSACTVTFGRRGSRGQTQTKDYGDPATARREHDKIVAEKLRKGYVETTAGTAPSRPPTPAPAPMAPPSPRRAAFEAALAANPDDRAAHMAYADFLIEQGDPRGELIRVQLALEDEHCPPEERRRWQQREKTLLDVHARTWLGDLARWLIDQESVEDCDRERGAGFAFRFARGWIDALDVLFLLDAFADAFVRSAPRLRLLRRLTIRYRHEEDTPASRLAEANCLGNVRQFRLGSEDDPRHMDGGDVVALLMQMPRLEELYLHAQGVPVEVVFGLPWPELRTLHVLRLRNYPLERLAANPTLTGLRTLSLWPRGSEPGEADPCITPAGFLALVRSPYLTSLTHLEVHRTDVGDAEMAELVRSGLLKRLKTLAIIGGRISDTGAAVLAATADLRRLERLDLSHNRMTPAGVAALRTTGVALTADVRVVLG